MQKMSLLTRGTIVAILLALVLSSLPTTSVLAKGNNQGLEDKWDQLVTNYDRQSLTHNGAHKWVANWLKSKQNASDKEEIHKHLSICNSALASAKAIVGKHAGFDADGHVVDKALAQKSINDLANYLRQHAASIKHLKEHIG